MLHHIIVVELLGEEEEFTALGYFTVNKGIIISIIGIIDIYIFVPQGGPYITANLYCIFLNEDER